MESGSTASFVPCDVRRDRGILIAMPPPTWGDLVALVESAVAGEDWERGEEVVERMTRDAELSGDLEQMASARYYEGVVREGGLEQAVRTHLEARAAHEEAEPESATLSGRMAAECLLGLRRYDEARLVLQKAVDLGERTIGRKHPETLMARVTLGRALAAGVSTWAGFVPLAQLTRELSGEPTREPIATAWSFLAELYDHPIGSRVGAKVSAWYASELAPPATEMCAVTRAQLARFADVRIDDDELAAWRVTYFDDEVEVGHIAHPHQGCFEVKNAGRLVPGMIVHARWNMTRTAFDVVV